MTDNPVHQYEDSLTLPASGATTGARMRPRKTVAEIQKVILELPEANYTQLSRWFHELDWERWDVEIEQDSRDGKLDFLAVQAAQAKADDTLQEL